MRAQRWRGVTTFSWALRSCLDLDFLFEQRVQHLLFMKDIHGCNLRQRRYWCQIPGNPSPLLLLNKAAFPLRQVSWNHTAFRNISRSLTWRNHSTRLRPTYK